MNHDPDSAQRDSFPEEDSDSAAPPRRMFVFERGWNIGVKTGSHREHCHMMAPGQDFYHRLGNGEVFVIQDTEKLCLPCAFRRGLIAFEPKRLREGLAAAVEDLDALPLEIAFFEPTRNERQSSSTQKGLTGPDTNLFPS
jgi:hypothetical protein